MRDPYAEVVATAYGGNAQGPVVRHLDESVDDADPTTAMEREGPRSMREPNLPGLRTRADFGAGSRESREPRDAAPPRATEQSLRRAEPRSFAPPPRFSPPPEAVVMPPRPLSTASAPTATRPGAPYFVWIVASVLAGIISYHVAPEVASRIEAPRQKAQAQLQADPIPVPVTQGQ